MEARNPQSKVVSTRVNDGRTVCVFVIILMSPCTERTARLPLTHIVGALTRLAEGYFGIVFAFSSHNFRFCTCMISASDMPVLGVVGTFYRDQI